MSVGEVLRSKATEQRAAGNVLVDSDTFATDPKKQLAAMVGLMSANVYEALADVADTFPVEPSVIQAKRKKIMERNDAIRKAAAAGKWDEFDKLAAGMDPTAPG